MPTIPHLPDEFFLNWLPTAFQGVAALASSTPPGARTHATPANSVGALAFWIGDEAPFTLRMRDGQLQVERNLPDDCIAQVGMSAADFEPVLVRGAEALMAQGAPERQLSVLRALDLEPERVALIRSVPGSVAFVMKAETAEHRLVLTPGQRPRATEITECTVRCVLADFLAMQRGETNPFDLMMNGRLQISGDAQIPMALSSLFM